MERGPMRAPGRKLTAVSKGTPMMPMSKVSWGCVRQRTCGKWPKVEMPEKAHCQFHVFWSAGSQVISSVMEPFYSRHSPISAPIHLLGLRTARVGPVGTTVWRQDKTCWCSTDSTKNGCLNLKTMRTLNNLSLSSLLHHRPSVIILYATSRRRYHHCTHLSPLSYMSTRSKC